MIEKLLKARVILKHNELAAWNDSDLILKEGEIGLAKVMMQRTDPISGSTVNVPTYLIKVGDNQHQFKDLNWVAAPAADVYDWGKAKEIVLVDGKLKFKKADGTFVKTEDGTADYAVDLGLSNYVSSEDLLKITGDIEELNAAVRTTDGDGKDTTTLVSAINKTLEIAEKLKAEGYYIPAIRPPTVQPGTSRLRLSLTANTNIDDIDKIIRIIREF